MWKSLLAWKVWYFILCWKEEDDIDIGNKITSKLCDLQHLKNSRLWALLRLSCSWKNSLQFLAGLEHWRDREMSCSLPHQGSEFCSEKGSRILFCSWKETLIKLNLRNSQQLKHQARKVWFGILTFHLTSCMKPELVTPSL